MINRYCVYNNILDRYLSYFSHWIQCPNWILFSPKINYEAKQSKQAHVHVDNINRKSGFTYTSL